MLHTKAVFRRKDTEVEATDCAVDKVIQLSVAEFDRFSRNLMGEWGFLRDNPIDTIVDKEGRYHCLLVVGEGRRDGILVNAEGGDYARYSAFMPNAEDFLTVGRYPALAELNRKLTDIVDFIARPIGQRYNFDIQDFEEISGIDCMYNSAILHTVLGMLDERPEINSLEIDKNELIVYYNKDSLEQSEDLSDPSVTRMDMYAYGYGYDSMIPLGKGRALELYYSKHEIFLLFQNGAELPADSHTTIEEFDGMFGVIDPAWDNEAAAPSFEAFIMNRERFEADRIVTGEWLKLPSGADTLRGLFERIGIDRPSDGAFTIAAVRVPQEYLRDHVSKYDSLDELNMLASFMQTTEEYDFITIQAIITSKIIDIEHGTAALINLLYDENLYAFELIGANDAEALGRYYAAENDEKPDDVSFEDYGSLCEKEEGGVFTKWGYIKFRHKELSPEYNGAVPDEYKITGEALQFLRLNKPERGERGDKPSVMERIRAARQEPKQPRENTPSKNKSRGEPEL